MTVQPLFEKFTFRGLTLANAFAMDPVLPTSAHSAAPELDVASLYRGRQAFDVGLMLSEKATINRPLAALNQQSLHFYGQQALEAWQRVHDHVVKAGGTMVPRLWHMGNIAPPRGHGDGPHCEGPSSRFGPADGHQHGYAMDQQAIASTIEAYGQAAAAARQMGFAAVEIDAAGGGLLDQFFWHVTNDRNDDYGGATLKERSKLIHQVLRAVRKATGEHFTVMVRLSQAKPCSPKTRLANTYLEMEKWLSVLAEGGADILHCCQHHWAQPEFTGSPLNFAGWAKQITGLPTITSGRVGLAPDGAAEIEYLVQRKGLGEFDLVTLDHVLAQEAGWVSRLKHGAMAAVAPAPQGHMHLVV